METLTPEQIDQHLDKVLICQLTWKPSVMRTAAVHIVSHLQHHSPSFADEVEGLADFRREHDNCIGSAWRVLKRQGIIEKTGRYRRSIKASSKGRIVWEYSMVQPGFARLFLVRNAPATLTQLCDAGLL